MGMPKVIVLVTLGLAAGLGCGASWMPAFQVPQVEQASEALGGGGERYAAHRACAASARDTDALIACMQSSRYEFITRTPEYPAIECWDLREGRGDGRLPPAYCFVRSR